MRQLNQLRIDAGYSISDIARLTGVDDVTACRWLCGNAMPDRHQQERLAAILNVEMHQLDEPKHEVVRPRKIDRLRGRILPAGMRFS